MVAGTVPAARPAGPGLRLRVRTRAGGGRGDPGPGRLPPSRRGGRDSGQPRRCDPPSRRAGGLADGHLRPGGDRHRSRRWAGCRSRSWSAPARRGSERPRLSFWQRMAAIALPILLLAAIVAWWIRHPLTFGAGSPSTGSGHHPGRRSTPALPPWHPPQAAPSPALVLVAVLTGSSWPSLVTLVLVIRSRLTPASRRRPPGRQPVAVAAVDAAIDALGAEVDPRRAVIAAYATMERLLGAAGSPRRRADAPTEHLERSLVLLGAGRGRRPAADRPLRARALQRPGDRRTGATRRLRRAGGGPPGPRAGVRRP